MQAKDLVVLKFNKELVYETETLKPNIHYRCVKLTQNNITEYLVYGLVFSEDLFNNFFETTHERMIRDFKELDLIQRNGKPVSKSKFGQLASQHVYGRGSNRLGIWFIRKSSDCIYGFYPSQGNKQEQLKECYEYFLDILNGEMDSVDCADVCFGNCGIPISYGRLSIR